MRIRRDVKHKQENASNVDRLQRKVLALRQEVADDVDMVQDAEAMLENMKWTEIPPNIKLTLNHMVTKMRDNKRLLADREADLHRALLLLDSCPSGCN